MTLWNLNVSRTDVVDLSPLAHLPMLQTLHISEVPDTKLDNLRKAIPNCQIIVDSAASRASP